jgi:hypothetical protein
MGEQWLEMYENCDRIKVYLPERWKKYAISEIL